MEKEQGTSALAVFYVTTSRKRHGGTIRKTCTSSVITPLQFRIDFFMDPGFLGFRFNLVLFERRVADSGIILCVYI